MAAASTVKVRKRAQPVRREAQQQARGGSVYNRFGQEALAFWISRTSPISYRAVGSVRVRNANVRALAGPLRNVLAGFARNRTGVTKGDREGVAKQWCSAVAAEG